MLMECMALEAERVAFGEHVENRVDHPHDVAENTGQLLIRHPRHRPSLAMSPGVWDPPRWGC
ncbi:hypothetical protein GORBP_006_00350 [Gordonia rubripertincta NBRC 101908]|uniref:Uncharacterized protein n=1 Tax=Gordonia rubripertincta NBRC 101908 TaxID=1077975 RepID=A0ABQ0HM85_GORRU|nr:hypothetical protein GORBP_006_00350 [Gordonia rubripertincta NBRC 101908]